MCAYYICHKFLLTITNKVVSLTHQPPHSLTAMTAKFKSLAEFEAAAPALAAEQRDLLYFEGDADAGYQWTVNDVWECLVSSCDFEGQRPVRKGDMDAARTLFMPFATAALAAAPQPQVGDLVCVADEVEPAILVACDYSVWTLRRNEVEWLEPVHNVRSYVGAAPHSVAA